MQARGGWVQAEFGQTIHAGVSGCLGLSKKKCSGLKSICIQNMAKLKLQKMLISKYFKVYLSTLLVCSFIPPLVISRVVPIPISVSELPPIMPKMLASVSASTGVQAPI